MASLTGTILYLLGIMSNLCAVLEPVALILAIMCMVKYLKS